MTINEYKPGAGIPPHIDSHSPFEEPILSISLLSPIALRLVNSDTKEEKTILIPSRSAFILTGESRYLWTHSIAIWKVDWLQSGLLFWRLWVSLTYRKTKEIAFCNCKYPLYCDYQQIDKKVPDLTETTLSNSNFEKAYV